MRFLLFLLLFLLAAPSTAVAETLLVKKTAFVYKTLETATSVKALRDAGADETKIAEFSLFKLACLSRPGDTLADIQRTDTAAL
ncbi:MAG: hypothetical protein HYR50_12315, partial [Candidatus Rokubacteria bacterium]|nr:hypothetical protein [Candidatus Rokubacteria bacterium]